MTPRPAGDKNARMDPHADAFDRYRRHGDLDALAAVFDALAPRLLPIALHLCGHAADAEDALQQTFLLAMDKAAAFDTSQRLEPWLAGLLQNVVRNQSRRLQRRRGEPLPELASSELSPLDRAEREELAARLRTHVDALPADQRQVLRLVLQHGMSAVAIAEVLEV
ncbi:MAG: sigma-70 family RNA polymerase sigma factor, partial [Planctomycetota bacterium]